MKYVLIACMVLGGVLLALLAAASANTALFSQYYPMLIALNTGFAVALAVLLIYQLIIIANQRRRKVFGSLLTFRVLVMFAAVAVVPGALVYTVSLQFLVKSIESWFDVRVDRALEGGIELGSAVLDSMLVDLKVKAALMSADLAEIPAQHHTAVVSRMRDQVGVDQVLLLTSEGKLVASATASKNAIAVPPSVLVIAQARQTRQYAAVETLDKGLLMRVIVPVETSADGVPRRFLQLTQPVPQHVIDAAENVRTAFSAYRELSLSRESLKDIYLLTLTLALLLALLASMALAFLLSRRLAQPLEVLAESTQAVASGDFTRRAPVTSEDELGLLTHSFNSMTEQLGDARRAAELHQIELEKANAYLSSVVSNQSSGVLVFDASFTLRIANKRASEILRKDTAALVGQASAAWPVLQEFAQALAEAFNTHAQAPWQREFPLEEYAATLLIRGSTLPVEAGGGYIVVFDEITQLINAQRATAWAEVARRVAHEIKNPLTPIQLSAERLEAKLAGQLSPEDAKILSRATQTIVSQVAALKNMVDEFREYARLPTLKLEPLALNALIAEVLELYAQSEARIELDLTPGLPQIDGDRNQLRQVLHNLLQNAQDALSGEAGGSIRLTTRTTPDGVEVLIIDNGPGMPEHILKRAFEPYVTTKAKGTGLGLPMVKKIVDEHRGRVLIEANSPRGTVVRLVFPARKPE
jgi:nitrogen fixation/metabolism regulation signal transduction histidine kinase